MVAPVTIEKECAKPDIDEEYAKVPEKYLDSLSVDDLPYIPITRYDLCGSLSYFVPTNSKPKSGQFVAIKSTKISPPSLQYKSAYVVQSDYKSDIHSLTFIPTHGNGSRLYGTQKHEYASEFILERQSGELVDNGNGMLLFYVSPETVIENYPPEYAVSHLI